MRFFGFGKKPSPQVPEPPTMPSARAPNSRPPSQDGQEIVVYGTADGSRCRQVRALLEKDGHAYKDVRVDDDLSARAWLQRTTGDDALPKVFIGTRCYGGLEDIQVLAFDGRLARIIRGETLPDGQAEEVTALKKEMSPTSIIALLRQGEILTIREGDMETDAWAEPLANPPAVYYEGTPRPITELEDIATHIISRFRRGEIEVSWKEDD